MSPDKITKPLDIYVRVSRVGGREGDSFISPEVQEQRCRAQLAADGLQAGEVFTDLDVSGSKASRPEFDRVMARALAGESGGVIVAKLSRFGRSTRNVLAGIKQLEDAGAAFISCDPKVDTSSRHGRFILTVFAALDELELEGTRESWADTQANAHERGIPATPIPVGYVREIVGTKENGSPKYAGPLLPGPHAPAVVAAFEARAAGVSWSKVAAGLRDAGVSSITGVRALIANRAYLGELHREGSPVVKLHEPLVELGLFLRANQVKGEAPVSRGGGPGALLARIIRCAACGGAMSHDVTHAHGRAYPGYRCKGTASCTSRATIMASLVEPLVLDEIRARLADAVVGFQESVPSADLDALREVLADAMAVEADVEARRRELGPVAYGFAREAAEADVRDAAEAMAVAEAGTTRSFTPPGLEGLTGAEAFEAMRLSQPVPVVREFISALLGEERVFVAKGRGTDRVTIGVEKPAAVAA